MSASKEECFKIIATKIRRGRAWGGLGKYKLKEKTLDLCILACNYWVMKADNTEKILQEQNNFKNFMAKAR